MTITITARRVANVAAVVLLLLLIVRQFGGLPDVLPIPPGPAPTPVVDPRPGSWIIIVEESEDRNAEVAKLLSDATWLASIESRQAKFRVYDDDTPAAQPFANAAGTTRPAVLIVAPDGKLLGVSGDVTRPAIDAFLKLKAGL